MRVLSDLLQTYDIKMLTVSSFLEYSTAINTSSTIEIISCTADTTNDVHIGTAILYSQTKKHKLEIKVL